MQYQSVLLDKLVHIKKKYTKNLSQKNVIISLRQKNWFLFKTQIWYCFFQHHADLNSKGSRIFLFFSFLAGTLQSVSRDSSGQLHYILLQCAVTTVPREMWPL